jgi:hypothetical protein
MSNPYKGKKVWVHASTGSEAGDMKRPYLNKSGKLAFANERLSDNSGTINANDRKDLLDAFSALAQAVKEGHLVESAPAVNTNVEKEKAELVTAALHDKNGDAFTALGEVIGDTVYETMGRQAFARKTLLLKPLAKSEIGRIKIRRKDVLAFFATRNPEVVASQVRQSYAFPPEFYLLGRILIEDAEIAQAPGDLLDDKYEDGLEQIMKEEDLVWKRLADQAAAAYNTTFAFSTFTPIVFAQMQNQVMRWGIPLGMAIISFDIWPDIKADSEFSNFFDPVHKHELVLNGYLGKILGTEIHTDGYRIETLKVLEPGEVYFTGVPKALGAITERQALAASPINMHLLGRPEKGWFFESIEGMVIANAKGVVKGQKV